MSADPYGLTADQAALLAHLAQRPDHWHRRLELPAALRGGILVLVARGLVNTFPWPDARRQSPCYRITGTGQVALARHQEGAH